MNNMLRDALSEYHGLRQQIDTNLLGKNGEEWATELTKFLRKESCWGKVGLTYTYPEEQIKQWQLLYKEEFDEDHNFSNLEIPEKKEGFDRLIVVSQGMTLNCAIDACAGEFKCWRYTKDLDRSVTQNDRTSEKPYAIWIRDRVEADEENKNLSADTLVERGVKGITLLERMLLELKYFRETGKHPDRKNTTLCSGSRDVGGLVPYARWCGGGFRVDRRYSADRYPPLRSREVVSL